VNVLGGANESVGCVGTLMKVYRRDGSDVLRNALYVLRESWGAGGVNSHTVDGVAKVLARYHDLDPERVIRALEKTQGGASGLVQRGRVQRERHGGPVAEGIASATVAAINRGRGGSKLTGWYRGAE
jgi:hypothetical protein